MNADRPRRARAHVIALGVYALLALAATYPMPLHLTRAIAANEFGAVDGFLGIWNIWWAARAATEPSHLFFTPLLFFPQGLDLFWQTLSLPQGLLALPVTLTLGPLPAYNLLILAGFILGGYTAFLFVRRFVPSDSAALVGGAVYALAPFHMQKVVDAQLEVASIQWVPLYLLALHMLLERRRWPWALGCGLLLVWVGLGTWYYGLFCLVYTGMAAGLWALRPAVGGERRLLGLTLHRPTLLWGLAPLGVWLLLMAPQLVSLAATGDRLLGDAREFNARSSADLTAFFLPSPLHPLWGEAATSYYQSIHPTAFLWNVSLGVVGVALALAGLVAAKGAAGAWRWWVLLGGTMLLAMGEELHAFGFGTGVPGPYALLADLPGIRSSHRPNHFVILSIAILALLAARGFAGLLARLAPAGGSRGTLRAATALALALILAVDGWAGPLPLVERTIPAGYANLPPPDGGGVLPVPVNLNVSRSENLWYQTAHGWPIVGGFIGREPPYPLGRYAPGVRELRYGRREAVDILSPGWPELARESLAASDIRYVLFHPDLMRQSYGPQREIVAEMGLAPAYADARLEIYPVPPVERPRPLVYLGAGWYGVEQDGERAWRWMGEQAELYLVNPFDEPRAVELELHVESFERARPLSVRLGDGPPAAIEVSRAQMRRTLRLLLEPGTHVVYLGAPADPRPGRGTELISLSFERIGIR